MSIIQVKLFSMKQKKESLDNQTEATGLCPVECHAVNDFDKAENNYNSHDYENDFLI
jgi:hypothetical protein